MTKLDMVRALKRLDNCGMEGFSGDLFRHGLICIDESSGMPGMEPTRKGMEKAEEWRRICGHETLFGRLVPDPDADDAGIMAMLLADRDPDHALYRNDEGYAADTCKRGHEAAAFRAAGIPFPPAMAEGLGRILDRHKRQIGDIYSELLGDPRAGEAAMARVADGSALAVLKSEWVDPSFDFAAAPRVWAADDGARIHVSLPAGDRRIPTLERLAGVMHGERAVCVRRPMKARHGEWVLLNCSTVQGVVHHLADAGGVAVTAPARLGIPLDLDKALKSRRTAHLVDAVFTGHGRRPACAVDFAVPDSEFVAWAKATFAYGTERDYRSGTTTWLFRFGPDTDDRIREMIDRFAVTATDGVRAKLEGRRLGR